MERPPQEDRARSHPDDDLRTRRPAERAEVLTLSSVSRYMVLRGQSTPAVIPDEQMERFRFMLDYSEEAIEVCSSPSRPRRTRCESSKGPLAGLEGELVTIDGKKQGGGKAGYAGLRPCGYAGGVRGESGKNGGGEMKDMNK